jgi:hypothetical protein
MNTTLCIICLVIAVYLGISLYQFRKFSEDDREKKQG